jgi:hypothetical protein
MLDVILCCTILVGAQADQPDESLPKHPVRAAVTIWDHPKGFRYIEERPFTPAHANKVPDYLRSATVFSSSGNPDADVRRGVLGFNVERTGIVYLVGDWTYQGNRSGGWTEDRYFTREDLVKKGWEDLGPCPWDPAAILFRRIVKRGETYSIRTNKYAPPQLLIPKNPVSLKADRQVSASSAHDGLNLKIDKEHQVPCPSELAIEQAEKRVIEIFRNDLAKSKSSTEQKKLARELLNAALELHNDNAAQFVLLVKARDLAADGQDRALLIQIIGEIVKRFQPSERTDPQEQVNYADSLREHAGKVTGRDRRLLQAKAAEWYCRAATSGADLVKLHAEKRLRELGLSDGSNAVK